MPITFSVPPTTDRDVAITVTVTLRAEADELNLCNFLAERFEDAIIHAEGNPYGAFEAL